MLLLAVALASPALAQNVFTVDLNGNVTATSVVTGSVVVSGSYSSGITAVGGATTTCLITFTNGGGTAGTATVEINPANTINAQALVITSGGFGYTSAPTLGAASVGAGGATSCTGTSVAVATTLGRYVLNGVTGPQPSTPASPHGLMWFDNATDWPLAVPMALDSSGNASAMVRTAKGTAIGSYTPYYSSIGGLTPPTATLNVYNSTPSTVTIAQGVHTGTITATAGGPYTTVGSNAVVQYCVQITGSTAFKWGTDPTCVAFTGGTGSLSTSPVMLSNNVTVTFSAASGGTTGDNWVITATPGGSTTELIREGINQNGNIWEVDNNATTPVAQWVVTQGGNLQGGPGDTLAIAGSGGSTATVQAPSSFTSYNFNLPASAGTTGSVLTSAGGSTAMTWTALNATAMTWFGGYVAAGQPNSPNTAYIGPGQAGTGATIGNRVWISPMACTLRNLYVEITTAQPGSGGLVLTIYDNGGAPNTLGTSTGISAPFAASAIAYSTASDTTDFHAVAAGDYLTLQVTNNASATSGTIGAWGVACVAY